MQALQSVTTEIFGVPTGLPWIVAGVLVAAVTCASVVPARRAGHVHFARPR